MISTPVKKEGKPNVGFASSPIGTERTCSGFSKVDAAHGKVDARSPSSLKEAGNLALTKGDVARAVHMYTLGIDMCLGPSLEARPKDP